METRVDVPSGQSSNPGPNLGRILILGGSGFIGSRLAALLRSSGASVKVGDIRPPQFAEEPWSYCDVRDQQSIVELARETDILINLAAEHRDDVRPLSRYRETNVDGAKHVCAAASQLGIRKVLFASSVAVYGFQSHPVEENGPFSPFNEYGKTKLEAEGVYRAWAAEDPSRTLVIVRPTVVFGEDNRGNVYNLLRQIASGRFLMVGKGANRKSMAYVGNVAAFLLHVLASAPGVHVFNYADTPDMNTRDLVAHVRRSMSKSGKVPTLPYPLALGCGHALDVLARLSGRSFPISAVRIQKFCADTRVRANKAAQTGFVPPYSLAEGLTRTIHHEFRPRAAVQPAHSFPEKHLAPNSTETDAA
jgi:nucleoside-diphosphate-sugar epimerase